MVGGRVPGGCVAQGSNEQGLCSDADGSGVSRLLSRPELFLTLSDESNQSFFVVFLILWPRKFAIWINKVFCYC